MFKHHKHCVIEAIGTLTAIEDTNGELQLYLLDDSIAPAPSQNEASQNPRTTENAIRVSDQALIEFVTRNAPSTSNPACRYQLQARITGNVNMDGGEVHLVDVSHAIMKDDEKVMIYEPKT